MANPVSPIGGTLTPDDPATLSAIRRYEDRLAKDPTSLAFAPLADAYRKTGRSRDAIQLCRRGLERFPQYVTARLILAKALLDDGDPEGAMSEVRTILETSPHEAQAHRLAGDLYRRAGALADAIGHLEHAVRLDPGDRESRALLDVLGAGGTVPEGSALKQLLTDDTFATLSFGTPLPRAGAGRRGGADLPASARSRPGPCPRPGGPRGGAPTQDSTTERALTAWWCPRPNSRRG